VVILSSSLIGKGMDNTLLVEQDEQGTAFDPVLMEKIAREHELLETRK